MPQVAESKSPAAPVSSAAWHDTSSALLATLRDLPEDSQRAVLSYAQYLQYQEALRLSEAEHDAEWERLFNDPVKMANFAKWADQCFENQTAELFDESKL